MPPAQGGRSVHLLTSKQSPHFNCFKFCTCILEKKPKPNQPHDKTQENWPVFLFTTIACSQERRRRAATGSTGSSPSLYSCAQLHALVSRPLRIRPTFVLDSNPQQAQPPSSKEQTADLQVLLCLLNSPFELLHYSRGSEPVYFSSTAIIV